MFPPLSEATVIQATLLLAIAVFVVSAVVRFLRHGPPPGDPVPALPPPLPGAVEAGPLPPPLPRDVQQEAMNPALEPVGPYAPPLEPSVYPIQPVEDPSPLPGPLKVRTHWYRWQHLVGVAFFMLVYGGTQFLHGDKSAGPPPEEKYTPGMLIFSMVFQLFCMAIAIGIMYPRVRPVRWLGLKWRRWPLVFAIAPLGVLAVWFFNVVLGLTGFTGWLLRVLHAESMQDTVKLLTQSQDGAVVALMSIAAAVVAPVAEETIFRGYIYPVAKRFCGPAGGMLFACLLFAAAHGSAVALLPLFVLALILCAVYEYTGSLWAPMSIHFLFNLATVAIQLLMRYSHVTLPAP